MSRRSSAGGRWSSWLTTRKPPEPRPFTSSHPPPARLVPASLPPGDLRRAAVAAAQGAFHVPLEVHGGVLPREVQVPAPPSLDAVEGGVLAGLEVGVGAPDVRIAR